MTDRPPSYSPLAGFVRSFAVRVVLPAVIVVLLILAMSGIQTPFDRDVAFTKALLDNNKDLIEGRARVERQYQEALRNSRSK
jgi:hypothetical protein